MKKDCDIFIGDVVKLKNCGCHNSSVKEYSSDISFNESEIGNHIQILDIIEVIGDEIAYMVKCEKGITYLRRNAFELVTKEPTTQEDLSYMIDLFKELNIK